MRALIITLLVVVLAVTGIAFTLASNKKKIDASKEIVDRSQIPVRVTTYKAGLQAAEEKILLPATLKPNNEVKISALASGQLIKLTIDVGSYVNKNQVVGNIDTRMLDINLQSAKLGLSKAEADYQRAKDLFDAKAGLEINVINAQSALDNARIQVSQVQQQIDNTRILSPISGVVTARNIAQGEFASAGGPIATVTTTSPLKATVFVNETNAYALKVGQSADLFADVFPGKTFKGKIIFINPKGDDNHNFQVDLEVPNSGSPSLKAGTSVSVSFQNAQKGEVLQIPQLAIMKDRPQPYVYVVSGDKVAARTLVTGQSYQEMIEVQSGLQPGEVIVTSGQINLQDGSLISVVNSNQ